MRKALYSITEPKTIFEMTWQEVEEILKAGTKTVVLGVGATEQHGPHLPLGSDTIQVNELCKRTVLKLADQGYKAVAGPVIPFGFSGHHLERPGTITLSAGTLRALIKEVCLSLYHHGFRRFALVLGHGVNFGAMMDVAQELVMETEAEALTLNWLMAVRSKYPEILTTKRRDGHGGEAETSRVMAVHPELVEMKRAWVTYMEKEQPGVEYGEVPFFGGGVFTGLRRYSDASTPKGTVGDPTLAKVETGEKCFELAADWLAKAILSKWK